MGVCCLVVVLAAGCSAGRAGAELEFLAPTTDWPYPFSPAVRMGDLLFVSGQVGNRPGTSELVPGGIQAETRQALENIRSILEQNGLSMERVGKCTVMLADMREWPLMNEVYATFFPGPKPARSALGSSGLALGARVEIECIAAM